MKHSQSPTLSSWDENSFLQELKKIKTFDGIPRAFSSTSDKQGQPDSRIFICQKRNGTHLSPLEVKSHCPSMHRTWSDFGITHSFNSGEYFKRFKKNQKNLRFYKNYVHGQDMNSQIIEARTGSPYGLTLGVRNPDGINDYIRLTFHHSLELPQLRNDYLELRPGFHYHVLVTPMKITTDYEDMESIEPERRHCRFHEENDDLKIFKVFVMELEASITGPLT